MSRPTNAPHGTLTRYTYKPDPCRCDECRRANTAYYRKRKADVGGEPVGNETLRTPHERNPADLGTFLPGLRGERERLGIGQAKFASLAGCDPATISRLEKGQRASVGMARQVQAAIVWERREREGRGL